LYGFLIGKSNYCFMYNIHKYNKIEDKH
jgi:hypothetical protein